MKMTPILVAIETSTPACSVALTEGDSRQGKILGSLLLGGVTHSRRLLKSVDILMGELKLDWQDLAGVAISLGPGSFTGLRIGLATAKGIAMAAGLPLVGCSTLRCLAQAVASDRRHCIWSVVDARKKEVYAGCYRYQDAGLVEFREKGVFAPAALAEQIAQNSESVLFVGDGSVLYRSVFTDIVGEQGHFAPAWFHQPKAEVLGLLAAERLAAGTLLDIGQISPCYIRRSDAELHLAKQKKGRKKGNDSAS